MHGDGGMTECNYQLQDGLYACSRCGDRRRRMVRRNCPRATAQGVGDTLGRWLAALGAKKKAGCGCAARQVRLNRWLPYDGRVWRRRLRHALRHFAALPRWLVSFAPSSDAGRE